MSRPTFSAEMLVRIEVRGVKRTRKAEGSLNDLPMLPDDGGLCRRLFAWEREQRITPAYLLLSGGGQYIALYAQAEAARVAAWLSQHADRELWNQDEEITKPGDG